MLRVKPAVIIYKHLFSPIIKLQTFIFTESFQNCSFRIEFIPTFWDTPHNLGRLLFRRNQKQFDFIWFVQNKSAILT